MDCPACGHSNIPGADECDNCGSPLTSVEDIGTRAAPIARALRSASVTEVNSIPALTVKESETIDDVIAKMNGSNLSSALIVDDAGNLKGIVTERDILFHVGAVEVDNGSKPISTIMTADPHTLTDEDSVSVALNTLAVYGYRRVPVKTDSGYVMVTVQNLFEHIMKVDV